MDTNNDSNDNNNNLNEIITLKFNIEKEIEILSDNFIKNKELFKNLDNILGNNLDNNLGNNLGNNLDNNLDNNIFFKQYSMNINMFGQEYLKQQNILLDNINKFLEKNCQHCWIYDTVDEPLQSRNICYCSKCYLYKFKMIV